MIKALAHDTNGKPLYIFGLSDENVERLKKGIPIRVDLAEFESEGTVVIFHGKTEQQMAEDFKRVGLVVGNDLDLGGPGPDNGPRYPDAGSTRNSS